MVQYEMEAYKTLLIYRSANLSYQFGSFYVVIISPQAEN